MGHILKNIHLHDSKIPAIQHGDLLKHLDGERSQDTGVYIYNVYYIAEDMGHISKNIQQHDCKIPAIQNGNFSIV